MTAVVASSSISFATAPTVLVTLVAAVSLLCLRAWSGATQLELSRRVFLLLDGAIATLVVLFLLLVVLRFVSVG